MSNLREHEAEQARITAACEAGECDHPECHEEKGYAYSPEDCPSNHWNDGNDVCEDCGKRLNEDAPPLVSSGRTNWDRATEALELCEKMEQLTGVDELESQVSDILCHLMHLCRLVRDEQGEDIDFEDALRMARINFEAEVDEDPDQ